MGKLLNAEADAMIEEAVEQTLEQNIRTPRYYGNRSERGSAADGPTLLGSPSH